MNCKLFILPAAIVLCLLSACTFSVKPEELYGEWRYIKVEKVNKSSPDSTTTAEVAEQEPSIRFSENRSLIITWGGKQLSAGTFRMDGNMIRYKESLPGGATREFPFLVKEVSSERLVFETMDQDITRITALRK